jgi:hypothetical protein
VSDGIPAKSQCRRFLRDAGDRVDGLADQGDGASCCSCCRVVFQVDVRNGQLVEQCGIVDVLTLVLRGGELAFKVVAEGMQLGPALVDVADEVRVEVVGDLQGCGSGGCSWCWCR